MRKKLLVTATDLMMIQFLIPHIKNLSSNGFDIEIACSDVGGRIADIKEKIGEGIKIHVVKLKRNPLALKNYFGYCDLKSIINNKQWDIIWTNEPVMGVMTRLASWHKRKNGCKVIYMVHGFHFYSGAPWHNWILFYPIEKIMSHLTDVIVTINQEDYKRAKKFQTAEVKYIHGIGADLKRFNTNIAGIKRSELGIGNDAFVVLSVGELNKNKNHRVIIKALSKISDKSIYYLLCGTGERLIYLKNLSMKLGVEKNVIFLGYRKDIDRIYPIADLFAFPSHREGLGLASLEAMSYGLPLVTSNVHGIVDYSLNQKSGIVCHPDNACEFANAISIIKKSKAFRENIAKHNIEYVQRYAVVNVIAEVQSIFEEVY